jgi:hypothetical protein
MVTPLGAEGPVFSREWPSGQAPRQPPRQAKKQKAQPTSVGRAFGRLFSEID